MMSSPHPDDEGTKSHIGGHLIRLVGGLEFEEGKIFGGDAEACHSLTAVDVEGPDGFAKDSGDTGEEVGEGGACVEVSDNVAACFCLEEK